ncbi:MAG: anion transporter [Rhodospirillales bacterium]|nr:MAG: anion transporter [Rhodospirillales bacterium]
MTALVVAVFVVVYLGMALGRVPRLQTDRTGIALLGALVLSIAGVVSATDVVAAIDFPTLFVLFALMVLSAQFAISGFYDWCAWRIATARASPAALLALTVASAGALSAILANDVVVFAMTPMLCHGLMARGLDPRPFLIGLAGAANAGSAATLIGNPQNILIGQAGGLAFWPFVAACAPVAVVSLVVVWAVIRVVWRHRLGAGRSAAPAPPPAPDRGAAIKGGVATVVLLALFTTPLPHATGALMVAGALFLSRKQSTRKILGFVDWPLLVLFAALFVITGALSATGLLEVGRASLAGAGLDIARLPVMAGVALAASNTVGNVPAVVLILAAVPDLSVRALYALAILSTLAGNLLLVGSLANIIVAERARDAGAELTFRDHAVCGIPITLISFALALAWLWAMG